MERCAEGRLASSHDVPASSHEAKTLSGGKDAGDVRDDDDSRKTWHLVQIHRVFDVRSREVLDRANIEVYRPLLRTLKPVARKTLSKAQRKRALQPVREVIKPIFPGYLFVCLQNASDSWGAIFNILGIRGLVVANGAFVKVPWIMIDQIRSREVAGAVPGGLRIADFTYIAGETVRITSGPFASFTAEVERVPRQLSPEELLDTTLDELDESLRVELLVNIFGRQTPVRMSLEDIEKI